MSIQAQVLDQSFLIVSGFICDELTLSQDIS